MRLSGLSIRMFLARNQLGHVLKHDYGNVTISAPTAEITPQTNGLNFSPSEQLGHPHTLRLMVGSRMQSDGACPHLKPLGPENHSASVEWMASHVLALPSQETERPRELVNSDRAEMSPSPNCCVWIAIVPFRSCISVRSLAPTRHLACHAMCLSAHVNGTTRWQGWPIR